MKQTLLFGFLFCGMISCQGQHKEGTTQPTTDTAVQPDPIAAYYEANKGDESPSQSGGSVSKGTLVNGKLFPFNGANFRYFDTQSYLNGRAFVHHRVKKAALATYEDLDRELPGRRFFIMECSNKEGGKLFPHQTHQNGLSVDFMMPLLKEKQAWYGLDTMGSGHYWLSFDNQGRYSLDSSISIDFETVARHILLLEEQARKNGLKISKVIIKIELKDELFAGTYGKKLKTSGIYVVQALTPLVNAVHDDHYHIDFELLK